MPSQSMESTRRKLATLAAFMTSSASFSARIKVSPGLAQGSNSRFCSIASTT